LGVLVILKLLARYHCNVKRFSYYGHYLQVNVVLHPWGSIAKHTHKKECSDILRNMLHYDKKHLPAGLQLIP